MTSLLWEGNDVDQDDTLSYTVYFDTVDGCKIPQVNKLELVNQRIKFRFKVEQLIIGGSKHQMVLVASIL